MNTGIRLADINNENGSALITTVLILMVVTVIGIISSRTADIEMHIATHDKVHKMTWFATDATVDGVVPGFLEQAIEERLQVGDDLQAVFPVLSPFLSVPNVEFYDNVATGVSAVDTPFPNNADIVLASGAMGQADVFVRVYGETLPMAGTSMVKDAGYLGFGKSAARRGTMKQYNIRGLGQGESNSGARIETQWRYIIN